MKEKTYKIMKVAGTGSIAIGITTIIIGVTTGILSIITGASLLKYKSNITF